ncbi:hypothetical protein O5D80_007021 [Batrachochytrium dendrobatidis]|nr:hypothetical protein O5D80_007021 [Batrachochytrium dendrobatidis]
MHSFVNIAPLITQETHHSDQCLTPVSGAESASQINAATVLCSFSHTRRQSFVAVPTVHNDPDSRIQWEKESYHSSSPESSLDVVSTCIRSQRGAFSTILMLSDDDESDSCYETLHALAQSQQSADANVFWSTTTAKIVDAIRKASHSTASDLVPKVSSRKTNAEVGADPIHDYEDMVELESPRKTFHVKPQLQIHRERNGVY